MEKVKSNALWNELSAEQRVTLDRWLFEEKLSYAEALRRAQAELGFKGSVMSLTRYHRRRRQEKDLEEFEDLREELAELSGAEVDAGALREASMKLVGRFLFRRVQDSPEKVKEWAPVANLMVRNDYNELLREAKGEERRLRQETMNFAKERFEFDTMEKALKALPQLRELAEVKKDPQAKRYEENAYWNRVRRAMFGYLDLVHPESAAEEAEMIAVRKEREARRGRAEVVEREGEKISGAQPPTPSSPHYEEYIRWNAKREAEQWKMGAEYEI